MLMSKLVDCSSLVHIKDNLHENMLSIDTQNNMLSYNVEMHSEEQAIFMHRYIIHCNLHTDQKGCMN